jgi:hypothetical protein
MPHSLESEDSYPPVLPSHVQVIVLSHESMTTHNLHAVLLSPELRWWYANTRSGRRCQFRSLAFLLPLVQLHTNITLKSQFGPSEQPAQEGEGTV